MLEPLAVELPPEQMEALPTARDLMECYGLIVEAFGDSTCLLRAVPAMARRVDGAKLIAEVLESAKHARGGTTETHHSIAASIACHSAVRAGQQLEMQEMEALAHALETEANPQHCPHGRPTTVKVTTGMLEREFGRA
jgi:DNA mismatch repair protein MutL